MQVSQELTVTTTPQGISQSERLLIEHLISPQALLETEFSLGTDIVQGLKNTPKSLPSQYFYDDQGSQLFEQICDLPEYYVTRTETSILQNYATEIVELTGPCELVELGSGSSTKTRILLDAYQLSGYPLRYLPIDISAGILEGSAADLLGDYPSLQIHGLVSTYELALKHLSPAPLPTRMICFLGSTLGNFPPHECDQFIGEITEALQPGEYFLLGIDLHKSKTVLEPAYNDAQGVTAAFNLNLLAHLNWRFDGNFELDKFEHWSFYNEPAHQIEMHLRSCVSQVVELRTLGLKVELGAGETILTEISRKFEQEKMVTYLAEKGLVPVQLWTDPQQWFGLILCQFQGRV